ncbi:MAG: hypothetical protein COA50_11585 [Flavobacteriaceae bacterium]|nr:MAG: hypothetical protein COA50_11585 [Flavobacteriaceae bacterium]
MRKIIFPLALFLMVTLSCEDLLEVPDISEHEVQLLAPLNGSTVNDSTVNFTWDAVHEANSYLIQVATPNFDNASQYVLDSVMVVDSAFYGTKISKAMLDGTYEWRVKGMNSDYETTFSSNEFNVQNVSN